MPVVHIPTHMRDATDGHARVTVSGSTLRAIFDDLARAYPALKPLIFDARDRIQGNLAIAINATVTENNLLARVEDSDEIHLVPAIGGGQQARARQR